MQTKLIVGAIVAGLVLIGAGETATAVTKTPDYFSPATGVTALALLAWAIRHLLTTMIPDLQSKHSAEMTAQRLEFTKETAAQRVAFTDTLDKITDRHDAWERTRHEDSTKLQEALTNLERNCAQHHKQE